MTVKQYAVFTLALGLLVVNEAVCGLRPPDNPNLRQIPSPKSELNLKEIPFKIVYETYRKTNGKENWELYLINADGSNPVNLTRTADVDEMFPHVCPDGTRICFIADEGAEKSKVRNVYYMGIDGSGRVKVADNARQPCWSPDGKTIAYLKGEFERYSIKDNATGGLFFYDIDTGKHRRHPNRELHHIYAICWSPDGNWFLATVHGGMGFKHAILAFEADGTRIFDLTKYGVTGCRPELTLDGDRITWNLSDWDLCTGNIDLTSGAPRVSDARRVLKCRKEYKAYHTDFSPDGRYVAFSHGPKGNAMVGGKAPGWNICLSDLTTGKWVEITSDGNHNKEPDWVPISTLSR